MIMISFQKVVREKNVLMGSDLSTYKNGDIAGLSLSLSFFKFNSIEFSTTTLILKNELTFICTNYKYRLVSGMHRTVDATQ